MKKLLFLVLLSPVLAWAQPTIEVIEGSAKINGERYPGYKTRITADDKDIEDFLKDHFKELGKTRDRNSYFSLTEATIAEKYHGERFFYAEIVRGSETQTVWMGVDSTGLTSYEWEVLAATMKKFTYDFTVDFYKYEVQNQIEESVKAQSYAEKQHTRLIKESDNLASRLESNEKELIRLQEAIEKNKQEHIDLLSSIETNKVDIDSAAVSLQKIKEVVKRLELKKAQIR